MKIDQIAALLDARIVCGETLTEIQASEAFASDLMSDVLTLGNNVPMLITGLTNLQTIRTAEMADIQIVILARDKRALPEMIELATENDMVLMETPYSIFKASGVLFQNGIKPIY